MRHSHKKKKGNRKREKSEKSSICSRLVKHICQAPKMDFLQIVDPQSLAQASVLHVSIELVVVAVSAVMFGVCLRIVPEKLVPRSKTKRAESNVTTSDNHPKSTAAALPHAAPKTVTTAHKAVPAAAPVVKTAAPSATSKVDNTLDDVLDSFFEDEDLLDEALLDTATPSAEPSTSCKPKSPMEKTASSLAVKTSSPTKAKDDTFSKELAAKMTKGLQGKTAVSAPGAFTAESKTHAPPEATDSAAAADQKLDDALDAYLAEQQLLDEAILDSAVQEAQH